MEERYFTRFYTHLGDSSQQLLVQILEQVEKFVEETKNSNKNEQLVLDIKSHALKRQLSRDLQNKYREQGNIFCEFKKGSDQFVIKKWWRKNDSAKNASAQKSATKPQDSSAQKINPEAVALVEGEAQVNPQPVTEFTIDTSSSQST